MDDLEGVPAEEVTYCKAQCGQNVHTECIDRYCISQRKRNQQPMCPYCRAPWQQEGREKGESRIEKGMRATVQRGASGRGGAFSLQINEGYLNLGMAQGLSTNREYKQWHY
mmetsp:Transcript_41547/g.66805  ORF Transcript_41547/g.66805 Transcript_41547/m.66805 type:complete len:111 (+) Transcript_41547:750-1082(+)